MGDDVPRYMGAKKVSMHQAGFQEVLSSALLSGDFPAELALVGVQPLLLNDYGGSLTAGVKAQIAPAIELASGLGIEINWLPLVAPPLNRPSEAAADEDRGIRHRRYRAQAIAREIACYAEAQGLVVRDPYRDADPTALVLGWLWMRDRKPDRRKDLFRRRGQYSQQHQTLRNANSFR